MTEIVTANESRTVTFHGVINSNINAKGMDMSSGKTMTSNAITDDITSSDRIEGYK